MGRKLQFFFKYYLCCAGCTIAIFIFSTDMPSVVSWNPLYVSASPKHAPLVTASACPACHSCPFLLDVCEKMISELPRGGGRVP